MSSVSDTLQTRPIHCGRHNYCYSTHTQCAWINSNYQGHWMDVCVSLAPRPHPSTKEEGLVIWSGFWDLLTQQSWFLACQSDYGIMWFFIILWQCTSSVRLAGLACTLTTCMYHKLLVCSYLTMHCHTNNNISSCYIWRKAHEPQKYSLHTRPSSRWDLGMKLSVTGKC